MTGHELLPLAVLASSLLPGLIIFALPETWIGVRTFLNVFGAIAKLGLVALLLAGVAAGVLLALGYAVWQLRSMGFLRAPVFETVRVVLERRLRVYDRLVLPLADASGRVEKVLVLIDNARDESLARGRWGTRTAARPQRDDAASAPA